VSDPDPNAGPGGDTTGQRPPHRGGLALQEDETGYLTAGRDHLYVLDLATGRAELITPGEYDEAVPAGRRTAVDRVREPPPRRIDRDDNYDLYVVDAVGGARPAS
jgi:hypothetical protein